MKEYSLRLKLREKTLQFRKWKVKDKNKFLKNLDDCKLVKEALVYDCLADKNIVLSEEEYKYVLLCIRAESLGSIFTYSFVCESCKKEYNHTINIRETQKPNFKKYSEISIDGNNFKISDIKNREFYDKMMSEAGEREKYLIDFILHIDAYNDNDGIAFNDIDNIINNLDINIFEKIISEWDSMKFRINSINEVKCPHCHNKQSYDFDTLPGFFPDSWEL